MGFDVELCEVDGGVSGYDLWENTFPVYYFAVDVPLNEVYSCEGPNELLDKVREAVVASGESLPDSPSFEYGKIRKSELGDCYWIEVVVA